MNYTELVAAISNTTENTFATADMNRFIQQAERRIYNAVQFPSLRKNVTGNATASNAYLACPDDMLAVYSLAIVHPVTGAYTYLLNKDVNFIRECYSVPATTGAPRYYALFGPRSDAPTELTMLLGPTPDVSYSAELHYFFYPASITVATTSWLGDNFDPVLFYGALVEAYTFMKGEQDMLALYDTKYKEALLIAKRLGDGLERQDAYRSGQARIEVK